MFCVLDHSHTYTQRERVSAYVCMCALLALLIRLTLAFCSDSSDEDSDNSAHSDGIDDLDDTQVEGAYPFSPEAKRKKRREREKRKKVGGSGTSGATMSHSPDYNKRGTVHKMDMLANPAAAKARVSKRGEILDGPLLTTDPVDEYVTSRSAMESLAPPVNPFRTQSRKSRDSSVSHCFVIIIVL